MKLFIAVTTYEDKIFSKCAESLLKNQASLVLAGHEITVHFESDLYVDLGRNNCVKVFLESDCTDLLFIDADLSFEDTAILKILKHEQDLVAGAYRVKHPTECYPVVIDWDKDPNCLVKETGLVRVVSAPTGFMKIKRKVFEQMIEHYKMTPCNKETYHFFETGMDVFDDGKWWGEDTSFCHKWRNMGGEVFVEPKIKFTHTGNTDYHCEFDKYIKSHSLSEIDGGNKSSDNGFMPESDSKILKELAIQCEDVVEVGCWKGKTTRMLLENVKGKVYAVDHWEGSVFPDPTGLMVNVANINGESIEESFLKNVGSYANLVIKKGSSLDVAKSMNGDMFDMVFIDANHEYEAVKADIEAWLPRCKKIIAGHDFHAGYAGVIRAVHELAENRDIKVKGQVWWCEL